MIKNHKIVIFIGFIMHHNHRYYGIQCGSYMKHLAHSGRLIDNKQSEEMNLRLEGYFPLTRLPAGTYLADQPEIQKILQ